MNILIYEMNLNGHRLEYIYHLYMLAVDMPNDHFYFVVGESFNEKKKMFVWPEVPNISIETRACEDVQPRGRQRLLRLYNSQKDLATMLSEYVKKYNIDKIFAISIIHYVPFLPVFLPTGVKIDGILYSLFPWEGKSFLFRKLDYLKYITFKLYGCFANIYTLNDRFSAAKLNKTFHTSKFKYLPDPYTKIEYNVNRDFRKENNISEDKIVFAHFGGLQSRKGTMVIMESLKLLTAEEREKYVFVFAGHIYDEIKQKFYDAYNSLKSSIHIIVKDEFCDYEYLASLCIGCNAILIPYLVTTQSSGLLGYASQFQKPVIAPSGGIIGRLVADFRLGITVPLVNKEILARSYQSIAKGLIAPPTDSYCNINCVQGFQSIIANGFH